MPTTMMARPLTTNEQVQRRDAEEQALIERPAAASPASSTATPTSTTLSAPQTTSLNVLSASAPSAMRTPISTRRATEYVTTP